MPELKRLSPSDHDQISVVVCRGCCCGDPTVHPGIAHDALLAHLEISLYGLARVRAVGCLLLCDRANVVVVSPAPWARRNGARPVWLSRVFDRKINEAIIFWIKSGGPGQAATPAALEAHVLTSLPTRQRLLQDPNEPEACVLRREHACLIKG